MLMRGMLQHTGLSRHRGALVSAATVLIVLAAGAVVGVLSVRSAGLAAVVVLVVLAVGVTFFDPRTIPVLAMPSIFLTVRVAGEAVSLTDVVLFCAVVVVLVTMRARLTTAIRSLLWSGVAYLALTLPALVLNPYAANYIEWAHEVVLVLGSMLVGFAVGRTGAAPAALWIYSLVCGGVAVVTIVTAVQDFLAAGQWSGGTYALGLHKNLIGDALAFAVIICFAYPVWMGGRRSWAWWLGLVCLGGVFASQSRQALAGVVVGVVVLVLFAGRRYGWLKLVLPFAAIGVAVMLVSSVQEQLASGDGFNSIYTRLNSYAQSWQIWQSSPWFGAGMRWWYTGLVPGAIQPPNAELEVLTTTGIAGLVGFVLLFAGALWTLGRIDREYGAVAIAVVVTRLVQAQFDLYWVSGQSSVLWIVAGIAVGAWERGREDDPPAPVRGLRREPASLGAGRS
jgi:polysaccharide biosynthesis protein PslJ